MNSLFEWRKSTGANIMQIKEWKYSLPLVVIAEKIKQSFTCLEGHAINNSKREIGDPGGIRTRDHLIKSQVLYQLSYRISGDVNRQDTGYRRFVN